MQERRAHPRIPTTSIAVTILSDESLRVRATIVDRSATGLGLALTAPLIPGTPVKIELDNELLLCEVTHCVRQEGSFRAGLIIKHSVGHLADLDRLNRALRGASPSSPAVTETRPEMEKA